LSKRLSSDTTWRIPCMKTNALALNWLTAWRLPCGTAGGIPRVLNVGTWFRRGQFHASETLPSTRQHGDMWWSLSGEWMGQNTVTDRLSSLFGRHMDCLLEVDGWDTKLARKTMEQRTDRECWESNLVLPSRETTSKLSDHNTNSQHIQECSCNTQYKICAGRPNKRANRVH
jgi:hypothetical protein